MIGPITVFIVDEATGKASGIQRVPSAAHLASIPLDDGQRAAPFDPSLGDPQDFETAYSGGSLVFVPRVVDPAAALRSAQIALWAKVKELRDRAFRVTPTEYGAFDSDQAGRENILGKLAQWREMEALGLPLPASTVWKLADNSYSDPLTPTQLREVGMRFSDYKEQVYQRSWQLEAEISGAETIEALAAIDITQGWP